MKDYMGYFTTNSRLCAPEKFELLQFDNITGVYDPYKTYYASLREFYNYELHFATDVLYNVFLYIAPLGHFNKVYLPLNLTIIINDSYDALEKINKPPHLKLGIENKNVTVTKENYNLTYTIQLS